MDYEVWLRSDVMANAQRGIEEEVDQLASGLKFLSEQAKRRHLAFIDQTGNGDEPYYIFEVR